MNLKKAAWLLGGGAAILLLIKGSSLMNFARVLTISPKLDGGLSRITYRNLTLALPVKVDFANRSDQEVTVGVTSVKLMYNGTLIGDIRPTNNNVLIKKYSVSSLSGLVIEIATSKLLMVVGSVIYTMITNMDFSSLINSLYVDVTCIINKSIVVSQVIKLGDSSEVDVSKGTSVAGLGLVSQSERKIKSLSDYVIYLAPKESLKRRDLIILPEISPEKTPTIMHRIVKEYQNDTRMLARSLKGYSLRETIQNVFDFVYSHIKYELDSRNAEQLRRPLRTLYDQKGDCDCFSILIASIFRNLGIPYKFRIAAYNGRPNYQHVYVIIPTQKGYYVCDPVLDKCFDEKKPSKYLDF